MLTYPYLIELLTPRTSSEDVSEKVLARFGARFTRVMQSGCGISIPDNPMGNLRMGALETIQLLGLEFDPERLIINLNTFHTKKQLDEILNSAVGAGIRYLLVVRGDGGPDLPRLDPASIGGRFNVASSADLIGFINNTYQDDFIIGAAFNHYNPLDVELMRLHKKIAAGARFVVTQPVIGKEARLEQLEALDITLVVEAWMSDNIELFSRSVGDDSLEVSDYDPITNLKLLHEGFPQCCVYLSMLNFKDSFEDLLPALPIK